MCQISWCQVYAWTTVPVLVALRSQVDGLIREAVEPGGPSDFVTHEHVMSLVRTRGIGKDDHPRQLLDAIAESPAWAEKGAARLAADVVVASGEDAQRLNDGLTCFRCGPVTLVGYDKRRTLAGVRLRTGLACEMNIGCSCSEGPSYA